MNNSTIEIASKGLYASWCYHKPSRTLFDCGEGFATYQGNYIYGVERICISHGHGDHVLGLPSLIGCRNSARGDREKPLEIYYPYGSPQVENVKEFCKIRNPRLSFKLTWIPILPGYIIPLNKTQHIVCFEMMHQQRQSTLGYAIHESRTKLRPEFEGKDIGALIRGGLNKDELKFEYVAKIFAYTLDAAMVPAQHIQSCEMVVMDCTFVDHGDRDDMTHFTLREAVDNCVGASVKRMIAAHFSPRYLYPDIKNAIERENERVFVQNHGEFRNPYITPVYHNQITEI